MVAQKRKNKMDRKENIVAFLFILIPVVGFCIFTVGSMIFSAYYSFYEYEIVAGTQKFVGMKNYINLFTNRLFAKDFINSIKNTVILLLSTPISMALGLALAALLKLGDDKGSKILQS